MTYEPFGNVEEQIAATPAEWDRASSGAGPRARGYTGWLRLLSTLGWYSPDRGRRGRVDQERSWLTGGSSTSWAGTCLLLGRIFGGLILFLVGVIVWTLV